MITDTMAARPSRQSGAPGRGASFAGMWALTRFILRRDRVRLPVWILAVAGSMVAVARNYADTYPTQSHLDSRAELADSPLFVAFNGPGYGLDNYTLGAMVAYEGLYLGVILTALMSIFLVVRHTRAEEESGRTELVRAAAVGRHAGTGAVLVVAAVVNVVVGLLTSAGLSGIDRLEQPGAITFGAAMVAAGWVFATVAAVTAQATQYARGAIGTAVAVLGATYVLRAIGDVSGTALSWVSPFAWSLETRAFVDERLWPLLLSLALATVLTVGALMLGTRRDVGAGLVPPRPGSPVASDHLVRPAGTVLRLQRGSLIAWATGVAVFGAAFGTMAGDVEEFAADNEEFQELIRAGDSPIRDAFIGSITIMMALIVAGFAIQSVIRMRSEETAGRVEPLLATALSRPRWTGGYLSVALGGSAVIMLAGSSSFGAAAAIAGDDTASLTGALLAGVVQIPAIWVVVGVAMALFGLAPPAMGAAWLLLGYSVAVDLLGPAIGAADAARNLSPFGHVPRLPAEEVSAGTVVVLTVVAVALVVLGQAAFRRRDIATR